MIIVKLLEVITELQIEGGGNKPNVLLMKGKKPHTSPVTVLKNKNGCSIIYGINCRQLFGMENCWRETDRQHRPGPSKWPSQNSFGVNVSIKSITSGKLLLY